MRKRSKSVQVPWPAPTAVVAGILGIGLVLFGFMLPHRSVKASDPVTVTVTSTPPVEVAKDAPPSPPPPPRKVDCTQVPCVALTFDDGPSAHTAALLDGLAQLQVKATFFVMGQNVKARPADVRRAVEEGHAIGGHSWNHTDMKRQTPQAACADADRTAQAIQEASGVQTILVRPPYGSWNQSILAACQGKTFILWDVDTLDWSTHDGAKITAHALNDSKPGSILLMHDTVPESIAALPQIVAGLKAKGFELVTVPELFNTEIAPGQGIYNGPKNPVVTQDS